MAEPLTVRVGTGCASLGEILRLTSANHSEGDEWSTPRPNGELVRANEIVRANDPG